MKAKNAMAGLLMACLFFGGLAGWPAHAEEPSDHDPAIAKALEEFATRT